MPAGPTDHGARRPSRRPPKPGRSPPSRPRSPQTRRSQPGIRVNLGTQERILLGGLGCASMIGGMLAALWTQLPMVLRIIGGSAVALGVLLIGLATIWGAVASPITRWERDGESRTGRGDRSRRTGTDRGRDERPTPRAGRAVAPRSRRRPS